MTTNSSSIKEYQGQSPTLILKINLLQKRDEVLQSLSNYYDYENRKKKNKNVSNSVKHKLRSKFKMFVLELEPIFYRVRRATLTNAFENVGLYINIDERSNNETIETFLRNKFRQMYESSDIKDIILSFRIINIILDRKSLLKWDTKKDVDTWDLEAENIANHC